MAEPNSSQILALLQLPNALGSRKVGAVMHSNREIQKIVYYCLQEEEKTLEGTGAPRAASKPLIKQIKAHALAHQAALEASTRQARKNWNNVQLRAYEALRVIRKVDFPVFGSSATFVHKIEVAIKLLLYVKRSWVSDSSYSDIQLIRC